MDRYVKTYVVDDYRIVKISMEQVTTVEASKLSKFFEPKLQQLDTNLIIFDLTEVNYIDSGGIGLLLYTKNICSKRNCDVALVSPEEKRKQWFQIAAMADMFKMFETVDEAIQALRG